MTDESTFTEKTKGAKYKTALGTLLGAGTSASASSGIVTIPANSEIGDVYTISGTAGDVYKYKFGTGPILGSCKVGDYIQCVEGGLKLYRMSDNIIPITDVKVAIDSMPADESNEETGTEQH